MRALEARALLFQRKLQEATIDFSIPGLVELDSQLSVLELRGNEAAQCNKLAEDEDGQTDSVLMQAAVVCKGLVMRDTKERVFSDLDFETVSQFGLSVLKPVGDLITAVSGLNPDALAAAKKTLPKTPENVSSTASIETSEAVPQVSQ